MQGEILRGVKFGSKASHPGARSAYRRAGTEWGHAVRVSRGPISTPASSGKGEYVAVKSRKGQPNKRLKLTGPALKGRVGLCARVAWYRGAHPCAGRALPRSLSAIR